MAPESTSGPGAARSADPAQPADPAKSADPAKPGATGAAAEAPLTEAEVVQQVTLHHDLERAILGEAGALTASDVSAEAGVSLTQARRLWRALGFPESMGEASYNSADAEAMATLMQLVERGVVDFDMAVSLTRAVGQTMARLADWEAATLISRVEELSANIDGGEGSMNDAALWLLNEIKEPFEAMLVYAFRRHLAAAAARLEALGANEEDLHSTHVTVGFADIIAFTELTNNVGEGRIGDIVELFEFRCHDVVSKHGGRVIKSIGDSVLFVADNAPAAIDIAEGIINVIGRDPRLPDIRLGLATGNVVMRMGDVFGPPVNLASRLTAVARRNRVIIDADTAALLPPETYQTRPLPARPVRGFGLLEPVSVRRR